MSQPSPEDGGHSEDSSGVQKHLPRTPCATLALAIATGIVVDRFLDLDPLVLSWSLLVLFVGWFVAHARHADRLGTACLLVLLMALGALHHHRHWFDRADDDVERLLSNERRLLRVRGQVSGFPTKIVREDSYEGGRPLPPITRFNLDLTEVKTLDGWASQSGALRVDVEANFEVAPGDSVEVFGWAQKFRGPANPGEPDYRLGQQAQRVRGTLRPANTQLITIDRERRSWLGRTRQWLRQKCESALREQLQGDSLATALAFLLGDRSLLSSDIRNAFIETGTMHVLAISGVHVTVLAMFVATISRIVGCGGRVMVLVVLFVSAAYLAIADVRPPMTRAFVLIVVWAAEQWLIRRTITFNGLAFAAMVVMVLNPADLFDVGAQLSFLAVATMIWWARMESRWLPMLIVPVGPELPRSIFVLLWRRAWRLAARSCVLSFVIWLVTVPIVAATFHVVSPIGPLINVPLAVVASPALWVGFLFVMAALIHPVLASSVGAVLNFLLWLMVVIVRWAASVPYGHAYVPSPPSWWLFGIYGVIATLMVLWLFRRRSPWVVAGAIAWSLFGASLALRPEPQSGLRCTFLSVGHGCSVLIESPNGSVVVYDVGCISAPDFAKRVLSQAIWERRRRAIDLLLLSHADSDHFNGVRGLLGTVPVRRVVLSPAFLKTSQRGAVETLESIRQYGVPIDAVVNEDMIADDPAVELRVLHPESSTSYDSDNAGSLVIEVRYAGRSLLLTGDLEDSGLRALLKQAPRPIDILMAPHHGSLNDNPPELMRWARPKWVVASAGRNVSVTKLRDRYGEDARVLATSHEGAIEFEISSTGRVSVRTFGRDE